MKTCLNDILDFLCNCHLKNAKIKKFVILKTYSGGSANQEVHYDLVSKVKMFLTLHVKF